MKGVAFADLITIPDLQYSGNGTPRDVETEMRTVKPEIRLDDNHANLGPGHKFQNVTIDVECLQNSIPEFNHEFFASKKIFRILCASRAKALASSSTLQEVYWSSTIEEVLHILETDDYVLIRNNLNAPYHAHTAPSEHAPAETVLSRADLFRVLLSCPDLSLPLSSATFPASPSVARAEGDETLAAIAARIAGGGLDGVAIVDHGVVRGIVTARSLLVFLRHQLDAAAGALLRSGSRRSSHSIRAAGPAPLRASSGSTGADSAGSNSALRVRHSPTGRWGPAHSFRGGHAPAGGGGGPVSVGGPMPMAPQGSFQDDLSPEGAEDDDDVGVRTQRERRATLRAGRARFSDTQAAAQVCPGPSTAGPGPGDSDLQDAARHVPP